MTLHYTFPVIRNISQVLPAIEGRPEYIVVHKEGDYSVINYVYSGPDTFPPVDVEQREEIPYEGGTIIHSQFTTDPYAAILRECRGLIFRTSTGEVIARRFHKFFNANERPDVPEEAMIDAEYDVLEKLDGSMITPIPLPGGFWRWGTKMGVTDVALPVEEFVLDNSQYVELADYCLQRGLTPIFEWCSPENRIVIDHQESSLILTAIRGNETGLYYSYDVMCVIAQDFEIPVVRRVNEEILRNYREGEGVEGYVLRFHNGHMMKFKTEWYVRLHKTKDKIARELDVAQLVFDDQVDDLLPLLDEADKRRLLAYQDKFWTNFETQKAKLSHMLYEWRKAGDRKNFAVMTAGSSSQLLRMPYPNEAQRQVLFTAWEGTVDIDTAFRIAISKGLVNNHKFSLLKEGFLQGVNWKETELV